MSLIKTLLKENISLNTIYYRGIPIEYITDSNHDYIWVSAYKEHALEYGDKILKYKLTKKFQF